METQKVHCPECSGTGKFYHPYLGEYGGYVTCLSCEGSGIVKIEQVKDIEMKVEKLRLEEELKRQRIRDEMDKSADEFGRKFITGIVIIVLVIVIILFAIFR